MVFISTGMLKAFITNRDAIFITTIRSIALLIDGRWSHPCHGRPACSMLKPPLQQSVPLPA